MGWKLCFMWKLSYISASGLFFYAVFCWVLLSLGLLFGFVL